MLFGQYVWSERHEQRHAWMLCRKNRQCNELAEMLALSAPHSVPVDDFGSETWAPTGARGLEGTWQRFGKK